MATNHTEQYGLNLWEPQDKFVRTEFNENTEKIEAALQTKTDAGVSAALDVRVTALEAGKASVVAGTYVGTGKYGAASPCTLNFSKVLERPVKLVIIRPQVGNNYAMILLRGMTVSMCTLDLNNYQERDNTLTWGDNFVSWYYTGSEVNQMNRSGDVYCYVAIG